MPSLSGKHASFPGANWVLTALCFGWWQFGDMAKQSWHDMSAQYAFYAGIVVGIIAVIRTVLWLVKGKSKATKGYMKATQNVAELQKQRQELQQQLNELKKT